jgi:cytochrome b
MDAHRDEQAARGDGGEGAGGKAASVVKLWDAPVRLVHWSFVLLMPALWWTWRSGDLELHRQLGYLALALLLFRAFWGFAGSSTARFAQFVRGPSAVIDYVSGRKAEPVTGHNPLGGWSVLLLLSLLLAELAFGLFAQDVDGIESGPLARYVSYDTADAARSWHGMLFNLLLAAIAFHVLAILFYLLVRRDDLIRPMIFGWRKAGPGEDQPALVHPWRALACALPAAAIAWWVSLGCPI